MKRPFEGIRAELSTWEGITTRSGRFGAVAFYVGAREVGHVHGDQHADLPFPTKIRNELVASGRAVPHYFLPDTGWVSFPLQGEHAVSAALELFRLNYDLIVRKQHLAETTAET